MPQVRDASTEATVGLGNVIGPGLDGGVVVHR